MADPSLYYKQHTLTLIRFLDIERAFNSISIKAFKVAVIKIGLKGCLNDIMNSINA